MSGLELVEYCDAMMLRIWDGVAPNRGGSHQDSLRSKCLILTIDSSAQRSHELLLYCGIQRHTCASCVGVRCQGRKT